MSNPNSDFAREAMMEAEPSTVEQMAGRSLHDGQDRWEAAQEACIASRDRDDDRVPARLRWWLS